MTWIGHDLIRGALAELADEVYQDLVWTSPGEPEVGSLTEAVSRLYDDSGLGDALDAGREVYGPEVDARLRELGDLLAKVDDRRRPEEVLSDPLLDPVRQLAASILEDLDRPG